MIRREKNIGRKKKGVTQTQGKKERKNRKYKWKERNVSEKREQKRLMQKGRNGTAVRA